MGAYEDSCFVLLASVKNSYLCYIMKIFALFLFFFNAWVFVKIFVIFLVSVRYSLPFSFSFSENEFTFLRNAGIHFLQNSRTFCDCSSNFIIINDAKQDRQVAYGTTKSLNRSRAHRRQEFRLMTKL